MVVYGEHGMTWNWAGCGMGGCGGREWWGMEDRVCNIGKLCSRVGKCGMKQG